jgi:hypothetical protein
MYRLATGSSPATLRAATRVTLGLSNQKNGVRDLTITHESVPGELCLVKAEAHRYVAS